MTLKILCIGDVHIQTSNTSDIRIFIEKLCNYIEININKIDIVLLMGDILHTHERLHTIPFNLANDMFELLSKLKPLYVLVGNHDYINNSQFLTDNHWMNCFKNKDNIHIIDNVSLIFNSGINIVMSPFVPDGRFVEALEMLKQKENFDWKNANCIFGHQLVDGAKMGAIIAENVEYWEDTFPQLISGHIHDKQTINSNVYYTGSSMQHAFGESHDKTICLVSVNENDRESITIEEIDLELPKKQILYYDIEQIDTSINNENEKEIGKILKMLENTNIHFKITISGSFEQFKMFKNNPVYLKLQKNGTKVVFKNKLIDILNKKHLFNSIRENNLNNIENKSVKNILHDLITNDINNINKNKLKNIYNSFYNISEIYNNQYIEFID